MRFLTFFSLILIVLPCLAGIKNPNLKNLGTFDNWTVYTYADEMGRICYMASSPTKSSGKYSKRDDIFLMITHRPNEKAFNVINTVAGYTYKKGSSPTLTIDKKKPVSLVSHEDTAWAKDAKTDKNLVEQMKEGSLAVLKGTSKRGTATIDTFSLKGFSKAYQKISEVCNYQ